MLSVFCEKRNGANGTTGANSAIGLAGLHRIHFLLPCFGTWVGSLPEEGLFV